MSLTFLSGSDDEDAAHGQRVVGVGVDHVVEVRDLAILVADDREVELGALGLADVALPALVRRRRRRPTRAINLVLRLSKSALRAAKAPSSVVHTGVKSLGCEKRMPQPSPS